MQPVPLRLGFPVAGSAWVALAVAWCGCSSSAADPPAAPQTVMSIESGPDDDQTEANDTADNMAPGAGSSVSMDTEASSSGEGNPDATNRTDDEPNTPEGNSPDSPAQEPPPDPESENAVPVTPPFTGSFILGADISGVPEAVDAGAVFVDTDGQQKPLLELLANHGFNYIRLRTFVNPLAEYGYGSGNQCPAKSEAYNDRDHIVAFAQQVKAAGMGFLLDFHYSDTWADPGKQVIPEAWRELATLDALSSAVHDYTVDVVTAMVQAGARPDMVQVGNEITPGMLIHVPTEGTDCYGSNSVVRQGVNGSAQNWDNLAALLRAGIDGVLEVDESIQIMLHIENTDNLGGVVNWVQNAQSRGVAFDVLGLSAYEAFQGPSTEWRGTLQALASTFPDLSFSIVEYNPERRLLNDIMRELPDGRGLGTFFWEPTRSGSWGQSMFNQQGNTLSADPNDFAEYDQMRQDYGL